MNTRRSFLKTLGAVVGGLALTPQAKIRAWEQANAKQYVRKYRENSIPPKPMTLKSPGDIYCVSGVYAISLTGTWQPNISAQSGIFGEF